MKEGWFFRVHPAVRGRMAILGSENSPSVGIEGRKRMACLGTPQSWHMDDMLGGGGLDSWRWAGGNEVVEVTGPGHGTLRLP